jgi:hypothetical protein
VAVATASATTLAGANAAERRHMPGFLGTANYRGGLSRKMSAFVVVVVVAMTKLVVVRMQYCNSGMDLAATTHLAPVDVMVMLMLHTLVGSFSFLLYAFSSLLLPFGFVMSRLLEYLARNRQQRIEASPTRELSKWLSPSPSSRLAHSLSSVGHTGTGM